MAELAGDQLERRTRARHSGSSEQAIEEASQRFRELYTQASDYIHGRKADPGFDRCGVLWAFADATFWPAEEPRRPISKLLVYGEAFHHAAARLVVDQSRWLRDRILRGFRELGASDLRPQQVQPRLRFT